MTDLKEFADNIVLNNGIWVSKTKNSISYPEEGNDVFFDIEENSFWFKHRNNCLVEVIKKFPPNGVFFDIGGGNGYVSKHLQDNGIQTVLIEPGEKGISNAKKRGINHLVFSTLEDAGFKKEILPAVGLFDVVEHIEHDVEFLKNINHYLISNGRVYITIPTFKFLWSSEDDIAGHYKRYTIKTIRKTLEESGFEIEYSTYFFSFLPFIIFSFRSIPYLLGIKRKKLEKEKSESEHTAKSGIVVKTLNYICNKELNFIKNGKHIPLGSSCLIVAKKKLNV